MTQLVRLSVAAAREIYERVSCATGLTVDQLTSDSRVPVIARGRYLVMRAMRDRGASVMTIGRLMQRHHTTVLHGLSEHERFLDEDPTYALAAHQVCRGASA